MLRYLAGLLTAVMLLAAFAELPGLRVTWTRHEHSVIWQGNGKAR